MKNRLSTKLLFYIVLCSAFFTLLATAFQLYMDYRRDLAAVHESFHFIEKSYLPAIAASAWDMDEEHLRLQLQGALKLQDIEYLEIIETRTAGEVIIAAQGNPNSKKDIVHEFSLQYLNAPEGTIHIAKLRVTAGLEGVSQRLWAKAWIILVSNAVQIFLASFFIFLIIQFLITRHITRMAQYTQELDLNKLDQELLLDRRTDKAHKPDELDQLAEAFNNMRVRTFEDIQKDRQAKEHIKRLNSILMAVRNINQMIVVEKDRDSLFQKACNILTEARGYDAAWLGFSLDGKTFATVKGAGFREDISRFGEHVMSGDHLPCIRRAIAKKQKLVIVDKPGECGDCFFKDAHVDKDVVIIRVEHADRFYGLLAILFSPDVTADEEEKGLLKEVADDIGVALRGIELEEALVKSEQQRVDIINFLPDATLAIDLDGKVIAWNHAIEEMTGVKAEDMLGKGNYEYAVPFYGIRRPILIDLVFKPDSEIEEKYSFIRREGDALLAEAVVPFVKTPDLFLWGKASPMYDHMGNIIGAIESIRDISDHKKAEKKILNSLREKEVLLSEIHHRVKNNMQVISSLLNLQAGHIEDERILELFKESQSRVRAMALIHERLYQAEDLASIDFAVYIRNLTDNLLSVYRIDTDVIKLNFYVDDVFLDINTAIPCGLIINELVSNAFKHAFPDGREGEVSITLTEDKVNKRHTLTVSDDGISFPEGLDFRGTETFGMQLVNILTKQLHGTIELDRSSGTSFKIIFKAQEYRKRI